MDERLEALERLARLRDSGLLSAAELAAEKERILGGGEPLAAVSTPPATIAAISPVTPGFVRRYRWPMAAGGAALGLIALLLYLLVPLPLAIGGETSPKTEDRAEEEARAIPEGMPSLAALLPGGSANCAFGDELRTMVSNVAPADLQPGAAVTAGGIDVPGFPRAIAPRVRKLPGSTRSAPQVTIIELAVPSQWHGLLVSHVRTASWAHTQMNSVQVRFAEPPARVLRTLNGDGFGLPALGQLKSTEMEGRNVAIGVEAVPGGSALVCVQDERRSDDIPATTHNQVASD